ncbi:MAG: 2Fe-2S iron-sulfur cluster binding domain-containing protein, partial [Firmicutes bacterium]|nr:2Fe-2S iron-sulfur cluster binding domain-containing protein [Bacillota bacterium]
MEFKISFILPTGQRAEVMVEEGATLLEAAARAGAAVEGNCGGKGTCGKCKVRLTEKSAAAPTETEKKLLSAEELTDGWVLACQRKVTGDITMEVPGQSDAFQRKISLSEDEEEIEAEPAIRALELVLSPPTVQDQTADLERLLQELPTGLQSSHRLLRGLPQKLRREKFSVTAVC